VNAETLTGGHSNKSLRSLVPRRSNPERRPFISIIRWISRSFVRRGVRPSMRAMRILSPLPQQDVLRRYAVALAIAGISILLRGLLEPVLEHSGFYVTVYLAVVFSAIVCGLGPSILSAVVGTAGIVYWFVDPRNSLLITDRREIHGLIACILGCPVLIALGEANRRKQLRLNESHDQLERRVAERTAELSHALAKLESEMRVRKEVEEQLRHLSIHLMTIQDEERRRIARDLHDTAGQTLAAIKMSLAMLRQSEWRGSQTEVLLNDLNALTDEALREIRTTSYLLHPPLLDEAGFASAARWFAEGFTKRSGIQVHCDLSEHVERLPEAVELALFRVLQESLTNIHRHSGATAASVKFCRETCMTELQVSDNGRGLSAEQIKQFQESDGGAGVGIAGMRERVRGLGGELKVRSNGTGMTITVTIAATRPVRVGGHIHGTSRPKIGAGDA
jgi:signal transduction histidine kinase